MNLRQIARNAAVVCGTLLLVGLLWVFRQAIVLFVFSLAVAAAGRPYVEAVAGRGIKRSVAILLVYVLFIGLIIGSFFLIGTELLRELQVLVDNLARMYDNIFLTWPEGTEFQQTIVQQLPPPQDLYASFSSEQQSSALSGVLGFTASSVGFIGQLLSVLILSLYWSFDRVHFERLWLSLLPVDIRARGRDIWRSVEQDFGAYVRSELLQSILAVVLLGFGFWIAGMPYPLLLAIFGGLVWLIPWLGGVLAVVPAVLSGLTISTGMAIFGAVYVIAVLFFLELFIEPRFIRRGQFSSLLSILLIIALVEPFGLWGLLVAPPLGAALELIVRYNIQSRTQTPGSETRERLVQVRNRLAQLRETLETNGTQPEPPTLNLLTRLEDLAGRVDEMLDSQAGTIQRPSTSAQQAERLPS